MAATRLPNKPLADIGGAPMIVRAYRQAELSGLPVVVAAGDPEQGADQGPQLVLGARRGLGRGRARAHGGGQGQGQGGGGAGQTGKAGHGGHFRMLMFAGKTAASADGCAARGVHPQAIQPIHAAMAIIIRFSVRDRKPSGTLLSPPTQAHFSSRFWI